MRYVEGLVCALGLVVAIVSGCSTEEGSGTYAWCEVDSPPGGDFRAASFPDPLIGTIVGGIHRTTNGGVTWTTVGSSVGYGGYTDLVFTDLDTGTIVGPIGTILRTTDGGDTWVAQDSGTGAMLTGVSFADANTGLVVGTGGTILRTSDGGETWISQEGGADVELLGVWSSDANTATAVGVDGTILRTTDGGASWVRQDSGTDVRLNAVSFASLDTGLVVGENGVILRTTDGGTSWTQSQEFSPLSLNDVWFADANVGTIVGASGTILRTTNGGASWAPELNDATYWHWDTSLVDPIIVRKTLYGVSMSDADNGVAVGEFYGVARRTTVSDKYGVCDPWCSKDAECYPEGVAGCEIDCLCTLRYGYDIRPECETAMAEWLRCVSRLTCEQIDAYFDDPYNDSCGAAEAQLDVACALEDPCEGIECDDADECTYDQCTGGTCIHGPVYDGASCSFGELPGVCASGVCQGLCESVTCEDTECSSDGVCDIQNGLCEYAITEEDGTACTDGVCLGGVCAQMCVSSATMCASGDIDPTDENCSPALPSSPTADVCDGTESLENPATCTASGTTASIALTQIEVNGDCNSGYDLDSCGGNTCEPGGLAPGEGVDGVDNGLAGLAPLVVGGGGNLGGVNQAFYDGVCSGDIALALRIDANTAESCATVELWSDGAVSNTFTMNLSELGCLSGTIGTIPLNIAAISGSMGNAVLRATLSAGGLSNGTLGATFDQATAAQIFDEVIEGGSAVVSQVLDINDDLSGNLSDGCNALSTTLTVGGVTGVP